MPKIRQGTWTTRTWQGEGAALRQDSGRAFYKRNALVSDCQCVSVTLSLRCSNSGLTLRFIAPVAPLAYALVYATVGSLREAPASIHTFHT